jgi:urease gamma subunit
MNVWWLAGLCLLLLRADGAGAASMGDVDQLILKANQSLQDHSNERAVALNNAISSLHDAIKMVEQIPGLTEEQRDAKSSEIMATLFWCKRMMPLDMTGNQAVTTQVQNRGPSSGGDSTQETAEPAAPTGPQLDEVSFARANDYATRNPNDLLEILTRFESVAASYPKSTWGEKAGQEAGRVRTRLDALRDVAQKTLRSQFEQMEFEAALASLDKQLAAETGDAKKLQLAQIKKDAKQLVLFFEGLLKTLQARIVEMKIPLEELGVQKKAWVKRGRKEGLSVSMGDLNAEMTTMAWSEFGLRATLRLGERVLNLQSGEHLELLAIAATIGEDYIIAENAFTKLLRADPVRAKAITAYFVRAQGGYIASAEGQARTKLKVVKELIQQKNFKEGLALLASVQNEIARDSALVKTVVELHQYRREVLRRNAVDDVGEPISPFEAKMRRLFGGDVKVDEKTGQIEAYYDFGDRTQLRDWMVSSSFEKPATPAKWNLVAGKVECLSKAPPSQLLQWRIPISDFSVQADMVYQDVEGRVIIRTGMTKAHPNGLAWFWCRNGHAFVQTVRMRWYTLDSFIWRPGETAAVQFSYTPDAPYPYMMTVNGKYAISGDLPRVSGAFAFDFAGGKGSVDNVRIKGKLDMDWLRTVLAQLR